jgi:diaminopimelate decarboxylase/aspartate kinase
METEWWQSRRDELLAMTGQGSPLYVFNEETLNEILFDLLSIDVIDRLFYPVHANPLPKILRKAVEQGVGFRCISCDEMDGLLRDFPGLDPERIVFFPVAATGRDFARAFDGCVQVVVDDLSAIKRWPDVFQDRRVFIRGDMGTDQTEIGATGISVQGFYCSLKTDARPVCGPDDTLSFLAGALAHFPDEATLILGNGTEQEMHREKELMDVSALGEYLETFAHACPRFNLWLELPYRMLGRAGVLITRVVEAGEQAGTRCVRVHADIQAPGSNGRCGIPHRMVNLSRPDSDQTVSPTRIIGQAGGSGNWMDLPDAPTIIEEGDALVFTNMGAPGAKRLSKGKGWNRMPQHYLHARSMCRVRI